VIVVGADTPQGLSVIDAVLRPEREVRAFVSDAAVGLALKERGVKVAVGDVSDGSHVQGAATRCHSAVLIGTAALDGRERAFAADLAGVLEVWGDALKVASVRRSIWVGEPPSVPYIPEQVFVSTTGLSESAVAIEVARLDDVAAIESGDVV